MRRHVALLLTFILIFSLISSAYVSHAATSEYLWDFSDYNGTENTKTYLTRKGLYFVSGSQKMINNPSYGYMARINPASRWVIWMTPEKPGAGKVLDENFLLEFDFMQQTKAAIKDIATPTSASWTDDKRPLRFYSDGTDLKIMCASGTYTVVENYKANTVYNIKFGFNFENETIRLWVDDTALFTEVKLGFLNSISDISRFDFNNSSGEGDLCLGKVKISLWSDASAELDVLENAIKEAETLSLSLDGGDGIGQCDEDLYNEFNNGIFTAKKNYSLWKNAVNADKSLVLDESKKLETLGENAQNSVKEEFVEVFDMDFDSMSLEEGGWRLTGITPGEIADDGGNMVYRGTPGTRGLRLLIRRKPQSAFLSN